MNRAAKKPRKRVRPAAGATTRGVGGSPASGGQFTIQPAQQGDIPAVAALDAGITSLDKEPHWQDLFERSNARPTGHFFVVAKSPASPDALLGFIVGEIRAWEFGSAPCGWVYALGVAPRARGIGVGEALLDAIAREFRRLGMTKMRTMVAKQDALPMMFFRAEGMMAGPYIQLERNLG
ncbi:MAG TPA: GNAT family N-acetyltransferase [Steroidobacteraceae bacterium]|nr:GNAT family N-acetyltransferase [Steroidobacteraceae bacterium]